MYTYKNSTDPIKNIYIFLLLVVCSLKLLIVGFSAILIKLSILMKLEVEN